MGKASAILSISLEMGYVKKYSKVQIGLEVVRSYRALRV